ncbi:MAG: glycoside hydrolase family 2 TIM barrel-domain containing protein [Clostridium sp.]|nr:glycoside hydrolase family 2 TIM barrel-domain containing protein [Clostridium sp.]MDU7084224.1 glycoside hydrolase family 2 TIM barrel-domain containing protein [Clostridium sp.]
MMENMRSIISLDKTWQFKFETATEWVKVDIPHTWNNLDGQDGGEDYLRGVGTYEKFLVIPEEWDGKEIYIEFDAANAITEVFVNGQYVGNHLGGYSRFRFNITNYVNLREENKVVVKVSNDKEDKRTYPDTADFTFFGGIYRSVRLIAVSKEHFQLNEMGSNGVFVTAIPKGHKAEVKVFCKLENISCGELQLVIENPKKEVIRVSREIKSRNVEVDLQIESPILWKLKEKGNLYNITAILVNKDGQVVDEVQDSFGIRELTVDKAGNFILNGEKIRLNGVARHQDRKNKGWAISKEDMREDFEIIKEIGANSVRLAHYQHDSFFYDLCDEDGILVCAEIPFISMLNEDSAAFDNAKSQLRELILQNWNHPSICLWGVQNEITMGGESDEITSQVKELNDIAKTLDPSRLTYSAQFMALNIKNPLNEITDVQGYNLYYGWYVGECEDFRTWAKDFHEVYPGKPLVISEYGADGLMKYHSKTPQQGDYSEEYQGVYHEKNYEIMMESPWVGGSFVWNMFDFASNGREEGGVSGINHKGLVSHDRKEKKDTFYYYKAMWSNELFIHLCSRRWKVRSDANISVKAYTNTGCGELLVNGVDFGKRTGHILKWNDIPLKMGENIISIIGGRVTTDEIVIIRQEDEDSSYEFKGNVISWHEKGGVEGLEINPEYLSINDTLGEVLSNEEAKAEIAKIFGDKVNSPMVKVVKNKTVVELSGHIKGMVKDLNLEDMNRMLQQYPKNTSTTKTAEKESIIGRFIKRIKK